MTPLDALKEFFKAQDDRVAPMDDVFIVLDRDKTIERLDLDERAAYSGTATP